GDWCDLVGFQARLHMVGPAARPDRAGCCPAGARLTAPTALHVSKGSGGGQGWIRTSVRSRGQIYSLLPLTTRPPVHTVAGGGLPRNVQPTNHREWGPAQPRGGLMAKRRLRVNGATGRSVAQDAASRSTNGQ